MFDKDHNLNGDHGTDLIAYIYGELDESARNAFELHLERCDECAVELGAMSDARLGVVEWRREDFEHLATREIVIPDLRPVVTPEREKVGIFAAFIDFIAASSAFARAGVGVATAALLFGVIYFAVGPNGTDRVAETPKNVAAPSKDIEQPKNEPELAEKKANDLEHFPVPAHTKFAQKHQAPPSR